MNILSLNLEKPKVMLFHMPQNEIIVPTIQINVTIIEFVDNFIFLGVNLNTHLNWNPRVTRGVGITASKTINKAILG